MGCTSVGQERRAIRFRSFVCELPNISCWENRLITSRKYVSRHRTRANSDPSGCAILRHHPGDVHCRDFLEPALRTRTDRTTPEQHQPPPPPLPPTTHQLSELVAFFSCLCTSQNFELTRSTGPSLGYVQPDLTMKVSLPVGVAPNRPNIITAPSHTKLRRHGI